MNNRYEAGGFSSTPMLITCWRKTGQDQNGYEKTWVSKWHYPYWGQESDVLMCCEIFAPEGHPSNYEYEIEHSFGLPTCGNCLRRLRSGKW